MAKPKKSYICNNCGYETPRWLGKCPDCDSWNTLEEYKKEEPLKAGQRASISKGVKAQKITEVDSLKCERLSTGISELDRVLGGGIVTDSVVLMVAAPGTGKSTTLLQTANNIASKGKKVLYCSGEESNEQIKVRGLRIEGEKLSDNIYLKPTNSMDEIIEEVESLEPDLLIVDSIQTMTLDAFLPSRAGGPVQTIECTNSIIALAKGKRKMPVFIIGQFTKSDTLAGVNHLAHAVDTILYLEGDKNTQLRILRPSKNRFGSTEEVGMLEMTSKGLMSVENPNELFTRKRDEPITGCSLASVAEGTKTFVVEIQSLVTKSIYGMPVRNAIGYNKEHIRVLSSMLEARTDKSVADRDINIQVTGGLYIDDVAANLGVVMSIVSSLIDEPIPNGYVFIGEVGLTGEVTNVQHLGLRVKAIDRYGFKKVFIPRGCLSDDITVDNVEIVEVGTLQEVIRTVFK